MAKSFMSVVALRNTDTELREAFAQVGSVESAVIIMDKMSGRSKGFVRRDASDDDAQKAIDQWNGKDFGGRTLTVNEARPMEERPRRDARSSGGGYGGGNGGGGYAVDAAAHKVARTQLVISQNFQQTKASERRPCHYIF